jgi:hypothetical protein
MSIIKFDFLKLAYANSSGVSLSPRLSARQTISTAFDKIKSVGISGIGDIGQTDFSQCG